MNVLWRYNEGIGGFSGMLLVAGDWQKCCSREKIDVSASYKLLLDSS